MWRGSFLICSWHCTDWSDVHSPSVCFKSPKDVQRVNHSAEARWRHSSSPCLLSLSKVGHCRVQPHRLVDEKCPDAIQTLMGCVVTSKHTHTLAYLQSSTLTYPDHAPDVVSLQLALLCIRSKIQGTSDLSPGTQGKLMTSGKSQPRKQGDSCLASNLQASDLHWALQGLK